ncbi:hypothetical protein LTR28_013573 [Elasticomyces elasticus]|nr:hypothetical protein LTR28_013573 [Elasticomyces elasticus]
MHSGTEKRKAKSHRPYEIRFETLGPEGLALALAFGHQPFGLSWWKVGMSEEVAAGSAIGLPVDCACRVTKPVLRTLPVASAAPDAEAAPTTVVG